MAPEVVLVEAPDFPDIVEAWRDTIEVLDGFRSQLAAAEDTHRLAFGLDRIRELRRQLGDLERAVEADVATLMAGKTETIDGLGTLERRRGTDRKAWQSDDLLAQLVRDTVDPLGTGELPSAVEVLNGVVRAVMDCMPVTPSMGWRVTALKARGYDPDEWCTATPGRTAVQIHKADAA